MEAESGPGGGGGRRGSEERPLIGRGQKRGGGSEWTGVTRRGGSERTLALLVSSESCHCRAKATPSFSLTLVKSSPTFTSRTLPTFLCAEIQVRVFTCIHTQTHTRSVFSCLQQILSTSLKVQLEIDTQITTEKESGKDTGRQTQKEYTYRKRTDTGRQTQENIQQMKEQCFVHCIGVRQQATPITNLSAHQGGIV